MKSVDIKKGDKMYRLLFSLIFIALVSKELYMMTVDFNKINIKTNPCLNCSEEYINGESNNAKLELEKVEAKYLPIIGSTLVLGGLLLYVIPSSRRKSTDKEDIRENTTRTS